MLDLRCWKKYSNIVSRHSSSSHKILSIGCTASRTLTTQSMVLIPICGQVWATKALWLRSGKDIFNFRETVMKCNLYDSLWLSLGKDCGTDISSLGFVYADTKCSSLTHVEKQTNSCPCTQSLLITFRYYLTKLPWYCEEYSDSLFSAIQCKNTQLQVSPAFKILLTSMYNVLSSA